MATVNGTPVNFSFQSAAGITMTGDPGTNDGTSATAMAGILLQSATERKQSNRMLVKDGSGDRVSSVHHDRFNSATLKWKVSGTSLAAALTNTTLSQPGNFIKITACATMPDLVSPTNVWEIVSCDITGANEEVKEITYELEYAAGIQARAS